MASQVMQSYGTHSGPSFTKKSTNGAFDHIDYKQADYKQHMDHQNVDFPKIKFQHAS